MSLYGVPSVGRLQAYGVSCDYNVIAQIDTETTYKKHKCRTSIDMPLLESSAAFICKAQQQRFGEEHKFTPQVVVDISTETPQKPYRLTKEEYEFFGITFTSGDGYTLAATIPLRVHGTAFLTNTGKYTIPDTSPVYLYTDGTADHLDKRVYTMNGPLFAPTVPGLLPSEMSFDTLFHDKKCLFRIGRAIKGGLPGDLMTIVLDAPMHDQ